MTRSFVYSIAAFLVFTFAFAFGQEDLDPGTFLPNQQVSVAGLPVRTAESADASAVLAATLETIFHESAVCCSKDSALGDTVLSMGSLSLEDLGQKLRGRRVLSDGHSIMVTSEFLQPKSIQPSQILAPLMERQPLVMKWNSHLYVLYGALFDETKYAAGNVFVIHKLFLLDVRFPDARREVVFNRESNDWNQAQGLLILHATPQ